MADRIAADENSLDMVSVDPTLIELLLAHTAHVPQIFSAARTHLLPEHFYKPEEFLYRLYWSCVLDHYRRFNAYPGPEVLSMMMTTFLRNDRFVGEGAIKEANSIVEWVFEDERLRAGNVSAPIGYDLLQRLLRERMVEGPIKRLVQQAGDNPLPRLLSYLSDVGKTISHINSLQAFVSKPLMPDEFARPDVVVMPSRVAALDEYMDGGAQAGEGYVLLAPSGVGKTMTSIDIACGRAEMQWENECRQPGSGKIVVYCTYEESHDMVMPRVWARAAQINIAEARRMRRLSDMSTRGNLKEYETARFRQQIERGDEVPGELERYQAARPLINTLLHVGDFCGARVDGQPPRGHGGVPEIAHYIEALTNHLGRGVDTVIVDWAGMAVRRFLRAKGKDESSAVAKALTEYVDELYGEVLGKFNCAGWVMHQIAGQYNGKPPSFKFHHSHGEWCSSFAVNAWYAFTLSSKSGSHCVLRCTKGRRSETDDRETVCRIDGAFGRLVADTNFTIDSLSGRIESRNEVGRFVDSSTSLNDLD